MTRKCDAPGCTGEARHRTVMGTMLCRRCNEMQHAAEAACMAGNGTPTAPAGWWQRLVARR